MKTIRIPIGRVSKKLALMRQQQLGQTVQALSDSPSNCNDFFANCCGCCGDTPCPDCGNCEGVTKVSLGGTFEGSQTLENDGSSDIYSPDGGLNQGTSGPPDNFPYAYTGPPDNFPYAYTQTLFAGNNDGQYFSFCPPKKCAYKVTVTVTGTEYPYLGTALADPSFYEPDVSPSVGIGIYTREGCDIETQMSVTSESSGEGPEYHLDFTIPKMETECTQLFFKLNFQYNSENFDEGFHPATGTIDYSITVTEGPSCDCMDCVCEGYDKVYEGVNEFVDVPLAVTFTIPEDIDEDGEGPDEAFPALNHYEIETNVMVCLNSGCGINDYTITMSNYSFSNFGTLADNPHYDSSPLFLGIQPFTDCEAGFFSTFDIAEMTGGHSMEVLDYGSPPNPDDLTITFSTGGGATCAKFILTYYFEWYSYDATPDLTVSFDMTINKTECLACETLPDTLYLTFTATRSGLPECAVGFTFILYSDNPLFGCRWSDGGGGEQEITGCDCPMRLAVCCNTDIDGNVTGLEVQFSYLDGGPVGTAALISTTPLLFRGTVFESAFFGEFNIECPDYDFDADWDFEITATPP